jgi:hypothetical protein
LKPVLAEAEPAHDALSIEERLRRLRAASGRISGPSIAAEALRRENLYEERL